MKLLLPVVVGCCWLSSTALFALDWPQWRGPDRSDVSKETGLLKQWPVAGPTRLWLDRNAGRGYSGFSVAGGKVFTMGIRDDMDAVFALDENTGQELWVTSLTAAPFTESHGDGPRATPTFDSGKIYALGGQGTLLCVEAATGKKVWSAAMRDFGGVAPQWGYTESVLVDSNRVLCTPGGSRGAIVALDKETGKLLWQSRGFTDPAQYSSIVPATFNGIPQYVQLTMRHVTGVRASDGEMLWQSPWPGQVAVVPTPIVSEDLVYVTSGYGVGNKLVRVGPNNQVRDVYRQNTVLKNHHGGVVRVGDYLYGYSDQGQDAWVCQNFKTGTRVWASTALGKGALTVADGMLYCVDERTGTVVLADASPTGWKEHGRFRLNPQSRQRGPQGMVWTHPVVSNGKLFLRDQEFIFCFNIKAN